METETVNILLVVAVVVGFALMFGGRLKAIASSFFTSSDPDDRLKKRPVPLSQINIPGEIDVFIDSDAEKDREIEEMTHRQISQKLLNDVYFAIALCDTNLKEQNFRSLESHFDTLWEDKNKSSQQADFSELQEKRVVEDTVK